MDTCTQTSKTILELADMDGDMCPDSLTPSPRANDFMVHHDLDFNAVSSKLVQDRGFMAHNNLNFNDVGCKLKQDRESQVQPGLSFSNVGDKLLSPKQNYGFPSPKRPQASMLYSRRSAVKDYVDTYEGAAMVLDNSRSLTQTFLEKKQQDITASNLRLHDERIEQQEAHLNQSRSLFLQQTSPLRNLNNGRFKSQSYVDPPAAMVPRKQPHQVSRFVVKSIKQQPLPDQSPHPLRIYWRATETLYENQNVYQKTPRKSGRASTFMQPTLASEQKNQQRAIHDIQSLITPSRRGKSVSPTRKPSRSCNLVKKFYHEKIPYVALSNSDLEAGDYLNNKGSTPKPVAAELTPSKFDQDLLRIDLQSLNISSEVSGNEKLHHSSSSTSFSENLVATTIARVKDPDWNVSLKGLAEMIELCRSLDHEVVYPHMTAVNQKLLEMMRSSRSHVCRTACQAAGHFFECMKDTRKPEFDNMVEVLLYKTADTNRFIRQDANLSLDCMVTNIPIFHSVKSLCLKGPMHKNALVRIATIRLLVCAVVITGVDVLLNLHCHEYTRKRIFQHMNLFLKDKDLESRKYAVRLYKILSKDPVFENCLKKYLEKDEITNMKNILKCKSERR